jgi:hypothetical protein
MPFAARNIIENWRRDKVRITEDRWVSETLCYPIEPIVYIPNDMKVCALINKKHKAVES